MQTIRAAWQMDLGMIRLLCSFKIYDEHVKKHRTAEHIHVHSCSLMKRHKTWRHFGLINSEKLNSRRILESPCLGSGETGDPLRFLGDHPVF